MGYLYCKNFIRKIKRRVENKPLTSLLEKNVNFFKISKVPLKGIVIKCKNKIFVKS